MAHTKGRYQQDMGFTDGIINYGATDIAAIASAGTVTLTRNGPADIAWQLNASSTATFSIPLFETLILRTGMFEDTQNVFGSTFGGGLGSGISAGPSGLPGSGIPASAEPQGRPGSATLGDGFILPGAPQPASGMASLQQITPRTGLKLKGIKPLSLAVKYKVLTGAATALTCRLDTVKFANNTANVITNLLASGANGLVNVAQANPYVTTIQIPNAVFYQVTDLTEMWFEVACQEPAAQTFQLYGVRMTAEFNYN